MNQKIDCLLGGITLVVSCLVLTVALGACCGCSTKAADGGTASAGGAQTGGIGGSSSNGGSATLVDPVGIFTVTLTPANAVTGTAAQTKFGGAVRATAAPSSLKQFIIVQKAGGCELQKTIAPFCSTPCDITQVCLDRGQGPQCAETTPPPRSVGTITVTGVRTSTGEAAFTVEPMSIPNYLKSASELQYPPFAEGDTFQLSTAGNGDYAPFTISAKGIDPLETAMTSVTATEDQPLNLTWKAAKNPNNSTIEVMMDFALHGGSKGQINCNVADSGSLEIPADMINGLIEFGVSGGNVVSITRLVKASNDIPQGRVDLQAVAVVSLDLSLTGYTCNVDADCPQGKTCAVNEMVCH